MISRRDFHRFGTFVLGGLAGLALAVPGVAYVIDPLWRRTRAGGPRPIATLGQLKEGEPRLFPIVEEREDAWVTYPKEPVGSVWLVRGPGNKVVAFTSECPHLGCAVKLSADGGGFLCPCHTSAFDLQGKRLNEVPPRDMDRLDVELGTGADPVIRVKFERFQTGNEEKKPLA